MFTLCFCYGDDLFKSVSINYFDERMYQFVSCYRKTVTLKKEDLEGRLILHFEGAAVYSKVYLTMN